MDDLIPPLSYAPDGLYESDVDALMAEFFTADKSDAAPSTVADRTAANRHVRRLSRQTTSAAIRARSTTPNRPAADGTAA